ncbi:tyrosine recombinase XerC [Methanobrevibacter curvatus]|uniref:Tyrosine recombinase XerC n=2 Tax=Methanobrevibacter curvatus TaxID=49547 RepID=A0A166ALD1_9EURY|nr:tyrosine recombinase XerC [Methanobrevibacter curvatus]
MIKELNNDKRVQQLFMRRNISKNREDAYKIVLGDIYKLTNKTPSKLINDAKKEQEPYIVNNKIIFTSIEDRTITETFFKYYIYLINVKKVSKATTDSYLKILRSFYNEYDIELPKPISIPLPHSFLRPDDIPNKRDIKKAVNDTNNLRDKALVLLMSSSGIRGGDIRNFTVYDFLKATNIKTISKLLNTDDIIPCWDFIPSKTQKKGNICITFNTPEATNAIIDYLRNRNDLKANNPLFISNKGSNDFLSRFTLINIFRKINDELFYKNSNGDRFFHAHILKKFFINTCTQNSADPMKVKLLSGHRMGGVHNNYNTINKIFMKKFYIKLLPKLTMNE